MFANMKTGTKLLTGFGIAFIITAVVGISAWTQLVCVVRLVAVSDDAGSTVQELHNAQREEKNFELKGFDKYSSDGQSSVQKWEEHQKNLLAKLELLRSSTDLDQKEGFLAAESISAATEYGKAFASIMSSRTNQDKALDGWRSLGWEVTRQIEDTAKGVIAPTLDAANKAKDFNQLAKWAQIDHELDDKIVKPFLLLRTTAVYFILTKADKEWATYETQLNTLKSGISTWTEAVKDHPELLRAGKTLSTHIAGYEAAGMQFREAVLHMREADVVAVAKSREVEDNCGTLRTKVKERASVTMANAKVIIVTLVLATLLIVGTLAFLLSRNVSKVLRTVISEATRLSKAAVAGELQTRSNSDLVILNSAPFSRASMRRSTPWSAP